MRDLTPGAARRRRRTEPVLSDPVARIEDSAAVQLARSALSGERAWLVGGPVRDAFLDRSDPIQDFDVVVAGDPERAARAFATAADAHLFPLSERFGAWRTIARDRSWQFDLTPLRGDGIEADLALRDFTVNAMARPLEASGTLVDPHGGEGDVAQGLLRAVTEQSFEDDPLRVLRLARFACELGFDVEPATEVLAHRSAHRIGAVAPERSFYELRRLLGSDDPVRGIGLAESTGLLAHLLPELDGLKGVEQNPYHHHDVWGHTLEVLERLMEIERQPDGVFGALGGRIGAELNRPLADELTRGQALRLGALLHDAGKPATRAVTAGGPGPVLGARRRRRRHGARRRAAAARQHRAGRLRRGAGAASSAPRLPRARAPAESPARVPLHARVRAGGARGDGALRSRPAGDPRDSERRTEAVEAHLELARDLAAEAIAWRAGHRRRPRCAATC